jgi:integrase/recombinase XerD
MSEIKRTLIRKYIESLQLQKCRHEVLSTAYCLKLLFKYLNEQNIDFLRLKINEAQNFQTSLLTQTNQEGSLRYKKNTINGMISRVCHFYSYLEQEKKIRCNPFTGVKRVKRSRILPRNILNEEKTDILLRSLRRFWRGKDLTERKKLYKAHLISELMYSTGMRINEIMKLKPSDIDFTKGTVRISDSKSGVIREGILNEYCQRILKIYIDEVKDYVVFGKNNGDSRLLFGSKGHLKAWLNAILNKESNRLEFGNYTTHNFRHAVGFHLLRSGCDIRFIQSILGHKDLGTTQIYTKVEKEDLKHVLDKYHPRQWGGEK